MGKWRNVRDELPGHGDNVWLGTTENACVQQGWFNGYDGWEIRHTGEFEKVPLRRYTHWMDCETPGRPGSLLPECKHYHRATVGAPHYCDVMPSAKCEPTEDWCEYEHR